MSNIKFDDFSDDIKNLMNDEIIAWLYEVSSEITSRTQKNTRVDTGQLKGKWKSIVFEDKKEAVIGNPLQNAVWEEFGTGEYALNGDGRKGGWWYKDFKSTLKTTKSGKVRRSLKGYWKYTKGKTPTRAFHKAYNSLKKQAQQELQRRIKNLG